MSYLCSAVPITTWMVRSNLFPLDGVAEVHRKLQIVADVAKSMPWTSSLWILQEAALRLDSVF